MKKVNKKGKDNKLLLIIGICFALVIVLVILFFVRNIKYDLAKQDAILIGNLGLNKYLMEEEHLNNENIHVQYNLSDFNVPYSSMECPINNKRYETSVNSYGSSESHVFVNYHDGLLDLSVQLKCGKRYVKYSFSSDYSNKIYPDVEIFTIDVY